ncbi:Ferredoxin--NADP reductase [Sulfidibacter corallicola]|uniref:Ferredoxin--NADP reductase n=1 Tax=Sulfidibacter corallicola TaxID=2818388 RepID=A0A8A4TLN1_SULCO|nr:ferredoxin--NADP reductase [Sulfidibacter corallicola]QTD50460.1 ferredoxin--NADP reductase [Sulfidibacter corallicola]
MAGKVDFELEVCRLARTTPDTLTITFALPPSCRAAFDYRAGQFLTIEVEIEGTTYRRAYSLHGSPALADPLQITVKRVLGGRVSCWLHERLREGDRLRVVPPRGRFCPDIDPMHARTYLCFAAGSGITPVFSILKTVLTLERHSVVFLFYGCRDESNVLFEAELQEWAARHPQRFTLITTLSRPKSTGMFSWLKGAEPWKGLVGRIDGNRVREWITAYPPPLQTVRYLICGPGTMIDEVRATLLSLDVPDRDILFERYGAAPDGAAPDGVVPEGAAGGGSKEATVTARLRADLACGEAAEVTVAPGTTLLRALLDAGYEVPYSCEAGVCGTCKARLVSGRAEMKRSMALSEKEREAGAILTCQGVAASEHIRIKY